MNSTADKDCLYCGATHGDTHSPNCGRPETRTTTPAIPMPATVAFESGAISTHQPPYESIPLSALTALALRMAKGVRTKGAGAWNANTPNQTPVVDKQFVMNRLAHCIRHSYEAIARLAGNMPALPPEEVADGGDEGAILFAGALLAEHMRVTRESAFTRVPYSHFFTPDRRPSDPGGAPISMGAGDPASTPTTDRPIAVSSECYECRGLNGYHFTACSKFPKFK